MLILICNNTIKLYYIYLKKNISYFEKSYLQILNLI